MSRPTPAWVPPMRDGVSASRVAMAAGLGDTVLQFLDTRLPTVGDWAARIARGDVLDARGQPVTPGERCVPGQWLWYWRSVPHEHPVPEDIAVLHQDAHLVVVDKPHFLNVAPGGGHVQQTVLVKLKRLLGIATLTPMHRLDRETAGVLLFIVQPATRHAYHALLRERQVHKLYEAVAPWRADLPLPLEAAHRLEEPAGSGFMQMQLCPGEPNAHTRITLLRRLGPLPAAWADGQSPVDPLAPAAAQMQGPALAPSPELAHYQLQPHTGRKHQLRAQLNALGLPIVGDRIYPRLWPHPPADAPPDFSRPLQLLAREIGFTDPVTGQARRFVSRRQLALVALAALQPAGTTAPSGPGRP
ncbi:MAG: pseudouridine synthase [Burkholderiales bacterium PBB5]|nr:MAG: pseudouridine synthase [Burkholderiales bacterium PBB5]